MFALIVIFGLLVLVDKICGTSVETFLFECVAGIWFWSRTGNDLMQYLLMALLTYWWLKQWLGRYRTWDQSRSLATEKAHL